MKKLYSLLGLMLFMILCLTSCNSIGEKSTNMSVIYVATAIFSLLLLVGYCCLIEKKDLWFYVLFSSVFIVNMGYLSLAISKNLEEALLANRISYLGSVFLPLSMLIIITDTCKIKRKKVFSGILLAVSIIVFLIAASPGYLNIYYKNVDFEVVNGMSVLVKEYGSWHKIYLFYLLLYFALMVYVIIYASNKKKIESKVHSSILLIAVFVNICVWFLEQIVIINFEFLSVSYIITELFLIGLHMIIEENDFKEANLTIKNEQSESNLTVSSSIENDNNNENTFNNPENSTDIESNDTSLSSFINEKDDDLLKLKYFESQLKFLTPKEREIYDLYVSGKGTKDIIDCLNITENTLKYHNKNIYSKLGVTSRKQLLAFASTIELSSEENT